MKALQKRQMKRAVVNTRTTDTEDLETCKKRCTDHATQSSGICFDNYNRDISELESMAEYYDPEYIRSEKEKLGTERKNCLDDADKEREECIKDCKGTDEKIDNFNIQNYEEESISYCISVFCSVVLWTRKIYDSR